MIISFEQYQDVLKNSVFAFLSEESKSLLLKTADLIEVGIGEAGPRGDVPTDLFILLSGEFSFHSTRGVELGHSKVGRTFEMQTLLNGGKTWETHWICRQKAILLKVSWKSFLQELQKNKVADKYLKRVIQSVQIQKLKRDMLSLNVFHEAAIELIANLVLEDVSMVFNDWSRKAFLTIVSGEIVVSISVNNNRKIIATFQVGDSCYLDLENSNFSYEASPGGKVFVIYETAWTQLKHRDIFEDFLRVYRPISEIKSETVIQEPTRIYKANLKSQMLRNPEMIAPPESLVNKFESGFHSIALSAKKYQSKVEIQTDEMRSGAAAVATIARTLGHDFDVIAFEDKFPIHSGAKSLNALKLTAQLFDFRAKVMDFTNPGSISKFTPVIAPFIEKFVVVFECNSHFLTIGDPENGHVYKMSADTFMKRQVGNQFLKIVPVEGARQQKAGRASLFNYLALMGTHWWLIFLYFCAGILSYLFSLAIPFLNQFVFDSVIPLMRKDLLNLVTVLAVVCVSLGVIFDWFNNEVLSQLKKSISIKVSSIVHGQIFKMPAAYFKKGGFSAILGRFNDIEGLSTFVANNTLMVTLNIILSVFSFSIMWIYSPIFIAIAGVMIPVQLIALSLLAKQVKDRRHELAVLKARETGLYYQHFRSPDNTRIANGKLTSRWEYEKNTFSTISLTAAQVKLDAKYTVVSFFCEEMVRIVIIMVSGWMYTRGEMSLGKVLAITMVVPKIIQPIQQVFQTIYAYFSVQVAMQRLDHFFAIKKELKVLSAKDEKMKLKGSVKFENVSFKYENTTRVPIVDSVSFDIKPGEFIVVVGPTGSGKTTLAGLLGQLMPPTSGKIYFDGRNANTFPLDVLRKKIGYVEQEGGLFSGTIQQNIAIGESNPIHETVVESARIADIEEFALSAKEGYASEIGSLGAGVSEGQKQRLLIARAIYADPSMLILDESTSHLDSISEEHVVSRLRKKFSKKTVIFFTQRIHLASKADRIFYMESGKVVEVGSHKELIAMNGRYFQFFCSHLSLG